MHDFRHGFAADSGDMAVLLWSTNKIYFEHMKHIQMNVMAKCDDLLKSVGAYCQLESSECEVSIVFQQKLSTIDLVLKHVLE